MTRTLPSKRLEEERMSKVMPWTVVQHTSFDNNSNHEGIRAKVESANKYKDKIWLHVTCHSCIT